MSDIRIGISGWTYAPWRGTFFPKGLKQREELAYASSKLRSIEINGTFYGLQKPTSYAAWHEHTPEGFLFSVKGTRFITHVKRLVDISVPLANFLASGVLRLNEKLGPILWQLPPSFPYHSERLEAFLALLPATTAAAAKLARGHDDAVSKSWLKSGVNRPLRHALEVRHPSFQTPDFIALLRKYSVALVVADTAGKWPFMEDITADFIYVRLHGDSELYASGYTPEALKKWAAKITAWADGGNPAHAQLADKNNPAHKIASRDVFVYFDNDVKTRAPYDAMTLTHLLKLGPPPEEAPFVHLIKEKARTHWPKIKNPSKADRQRS